MKKIISFSLYGDSDEYLNKFISNTISYKKYFYDFEIYLYAEKSLANKLYNHCELNKINLILKDRLSEADGMFWRFEPIIEGIGDLCLVRDVDYLPSDFEMSLINEFITSTKNFHILRTHYEHLMPIMGGLFAIKKDSYCHFKKGYNKWEKLNSFTNIKYNDDQLFLAKYVYNQILNSSLIHTSNVVFLFEKFKIINPEENFIIGGDERHYIDIKKFKVLKVYLPVTIMKLFNFRGMRFFNIRHNKH